MRAGTLGTIVHYGTIKRERSIGPDPSGEAMYVTFDGVIGMLTVPTKLVAEDFELTAECGRAY